MASRARLISGRTLCEFTSLYLSFLVCKMGVVFVSCRVVGRHIAHWVLSTQGAHNGGGVEVVLIVRMVVIPTFLQAPPSEPALGELLTFGPARVGVRAYSG